MFRFSFVSIVIALFAVSSLVAREVRLPSFFQMDNVRAMAWLARQGLSAQVILLPPPSALAPGHGRVDMQWPPSSTKVESGGFVKLYVVNRGVGKNAVPGPFKDVKLRYDLFDNRIKSGHLTTSSGCGCTTSKTDFCGFHVKGQIKGCKASKLFVVRLTGKTLKTWFKVTDTTVDSDGNFEVKGTARGPLEFRFLDSKDNLVYYTRSR